MDEKVGNKKWCATYYKKHKGARLEYEKRVSRLWKEATLLVYSKRLEPECASCGIKDIDVLCIDHIDGGGNKHRRDTNCGTGTRFYRWLKKQNYPLGFQVLCFNCNMKKKIKEHC